jgi:hypothetical protein
MSFLLFGLTLLALAKVVIIDLLSCSFLLEFRAELPETEEMLLRDLLSFDWLEELD